ncbi:thioredoxin [Kaistia algarum]|uniref:DsbA family protein n=1 Tax=Kaistia algarum TaxID=2083279 RepID=UPI000CE8C80D|nr:thioredoxin [Kaistia algarum]MCX5511916.1 thioredoxin [Kaistia algarum]PPE80049.1 thioredoxin [Kaistia algarum]
MTLSAFRADPLTFGHGPRVFEMFLEPTCPYSCRAFAKVDALLEAAGEDKITVKLRFVSQPWHMLSGLLVRCVLAASSLPGGKETARTVLAAIAAHREEFEFDHHFGGANLDATPRQIIDRLIAYSGIPLWDAYAARELEKEIKWHAKYSRQNGIHVSPTFMVDGLVQADLGSGDEVGKWAERLRG